MYRKFRPHHRFSTAITMHGANGRVPWRKGRCLTASEFRHLLWLIDTFWLRKFDMFRCFFRGVSMIEVCSIMVVVLVLVPLMLFPTIHSVKQTYEAGTQTTPLPWASPNTCNFRDMFTVLGEFCDHPQVTPSLEIPQFFRIWDFSWFRHHLLFSHVRRGVYQGTTFALAGLLGAALPELLLRLTRDSHLAR